MRFWIAAAMAAAFCVVGASQQPPKGAGHWEGVLKTPQAEVKVVLDIAPGPNGVWTGVAAMPDQGASEIPLAAIAVQGDAMRFHLIGEQGGPVFDGKLSADGKIYSGMLSSQGESVAFNMKRTGEAALRQPPAKAPLAPEFEGVWQGALDAGAQQLRLVLKLSRAADGTGAGILQSIDQKSPDIPITTIVQKDKKLDFEVRAVNGSYSGTLSDDGKRISGNWTQSGNTLPLVFHRNP